jgi:hypothetical protein
MKKIFAVIGTKRGSVTQQPQRQSDFRRADAILRNPPPRSCRADSSPPSPDHSENAYRGRVHQTKPFQTMSFGADMQCAP